MDDVKQPKSEILATEESAVPQRNSDLLRFLTCGSVDDGKSTLIGRLLYDSNSFSRTSSPPSTRL